HARQCGTCGNCAPHSATRAPLPLDESAVLPRSRRKTRERAQPRQTQPVPARRSLTDDETTRVRKILACATRMKGRFGKQVLAATLRGSTAKNVMQPRLHELSTYGLLSDMRQDDILLYIDELLATGCLKTSGGEYPTISITEFGDAVMRERDRVQLPLPVGPARPAAHQQTAAAAPADSEQGATRTMIETFLLYRQGLSLEEIAARRSCSVGTIEGHLAECVRAGFPVDVSQFVSAADRSQIENAVAQHGTERLKPLRDALPETITYAMIRLVIADLPRSGVK